MTRKIRIFTCEKKGTWEFRGNRCSGTKGVLSVNFVRSKKASFNDKRLKNLLIDKNPPHICLLTLSRDDEIGEKLRFTMLILGPIGYRKLLARSNNSFRRLNGTVEKDSC